MSTNDVDNYISAFPFPVREILRQIRTIILTAAPDAVESIGYGIPAYSTMGKPLVYFAGFKKHIGFYATPSGHEEFVKELASYKQGKGSVQFPVNKPIPYDLIRRMVEFRVRENQIKTNRLPDRISQSNISHNIPIYKNLLSVIKRSLCLYFISRRRRAGLFLVRNEK